MCAGEPNMCLERTLKPACIMLELLARLWNPRSTVVQHILSSWLEVLQIWFASQKTKVRASQRTPHQQRPSELLCADIPNWFTDSMGNEVLIEEYSSRCPLDWTPRRLGRGKVLSGRYEFTPHHSCTSPLSVLNLGLEFLDNVSALFMTSCSRLYSSYQAATKGIISNVQDELDSVPVVRSLSNSYFGSCLDALQEVENGRPPRMLQFLR